MHPEKSAILTGTLWVLNGCTLSEDTPRGELGSTELGFTSCEYSTVAGGGSAA